MKKVFFIMACYCLSNSFNGTAQHLNFSGKINSPDTLKILFGSERRIDTLISPTGEFRFSREMDHPELLAIAVFDMKSNEPINFRRFFAGPGSGSLQTELANLGNSEIQLSDPTFNNIYDDFRSRFNPLVSIARKVIDTSYSKQLTSEGRGICNKLVEFINAEEDRVVENFIRRNSDNIVGAYVFNTYFNPKANADKARILYNAFPPPLQHTLYLKDIPGILENAKNVVIGSPAPVITATSLAGSVVELPATGKKYTVIDFWGTWCGPCMRGIDKMKSYFEKYKSSIAFIGLAYNDNKNSVQKVVDEKGIQWPQIINKDQPTDWVKTFNVYAAPTKIVIDRKGVILKIFIGETEEFYSYVDHVDLR